MAEELTLRFFLHAADTMLGEQIREARVAKGLTQDQLGDLVDSYSGYISRVERSLVLPRLGKLIDIAAALDVPLVIGPQLKEKAKRWRSRSRTSPST